VPPLFPLLFAVVFVIGLGAGFCTKWRILTIALAPSVLLTAALFLTDWDFTVDLGAVLEFFLPAFLCAFTGGLAGSLLGRTVARRS
jgi:hypothetical protein